VPDGTGPNPTLPPPDRSMFPTVNVVTARGWSANAKPVASEGLAVEAFANALDHPRWLHVLPNGDVLVAETNVPAGASGALVGNLLYVANGSDLVPDYMTSVRDGGFYGWPYSYFGSHVDTRVKPPRPDLVAKAIVPDYALGPHTASLGLAHSRGVILPPAFANGMFVGQHGSWNRKPRSGYKVIFVPFTGGRPSAKPLDVLNGFVRENGDAMGRPVGVAIDTRGALLVADDVGNVVWRVVARGQSRTMGRQFGHGHVGRP
jgi:glucose/arabinose dehydrogenase